MMAQGATKQLKEPTRLLIFPTVFVVRAGVSGMKAVLNWFVALHNIKDNVAIFYLVCTIKNIGKRYEKYVFDKDGLGL